ncbi:MAG: ribosomal protein S18-alanine N-acetyltransferase [Candidatus Aminicenantaceae bacterium]
MEEKDIPSVCLIENLSFPSPWHESTFRVEVHNRPISFPYVIVHKEIKSVIGYIIYWHIKEEVHINNIAVHPDFRRKGIAETVLREILTSIEKDGATFVTLEVRPSNFAALALYKKLGFEVFGVKRDYYLKPREDALILGKQIV